MSAALLEKRHFTDEEMDHMRGLFERHVKRHAACEDGWVYDVPGRVTECRCRVTFQWAAALVAARTPEGHWDVPASMNGVDGRAFAVCGENKTTTMIRFAKHELLSGVACLYLTGDDIVSMGKGHNTELETLVKRAEYLFVDDTDLVEEWGRPHVTKFLRRVVDSGKRVMAAFSDSTQLPGRFEILNSANVKRSRKPLVDNEAFLEEAKLWKELNERRDSPGVSIR